MRVLVVDDDPVFVELMAIMMEQLDMKQVKYAKSAEEALALIQRADRPFDCLMLDIAMPGKDGLELARELREGTDYRDVPIIMVTALDEVTSVDAAFAAGATDYLSKPVELLGLRERLEEAAACICDRPALSDEAGETRLFHFGDAIEVAGAEGLIPLRSLENYLDTLERLRAGDRSSVAFRIDGAREIYDALGPEPFSYFLMAAANSISGEMDPKGARIGYAGSGRFVCVMPRNAAVRVPLLKMRLNLRFSKLIKIEKLDKPIQPSLSIGEMARSGLTSDCPVSALIDRALWKLPPEDAAGVVMPEMGAA